MDYKVIFAPQAISRLEQIVSVIAADNPDTARRYGTRLIDLAELLAHFPELGQPYRKRADVRRLACKPYFIYYRVNHEKRIVEIMDYWHLAQREPSF